TMNDPHVERVSAELKGKGITSVMLDLHRDAHVSLAQSAEHGITTVINGQVIRSSSLIWNWLQIFPASPLYFDDVSESAAKESARVFRVTEWDALSQLLGVLYPRQTLNSPLVAMHMHKLVQQSVANRLGLLTPPTFVTNDMGEALQF